MQQQICVQPKLAETLNYHHHHHYYTTTTLQLRSRLPAPLLTRPIPSTHLSRLAAYTCYLLTASLDVVVTASASGAVGEGGWAFFFPSRA